jgi:Bax protein
MKLSAPTSKFYFTHFKPDITFLLLVSVLLFAGCDRKSSNQEVKSLPDFSSIEDPKEKKKQFFAFLSPIITAENDRVAAQRKRLLELYEKRRTGSGLSEKDRYFFDKLLLEYRVNQADAEPEHNWKSLIKRVDIVPLDLALIQAAKESGWGTSRFVREGNNMFGQRCFTKGCGIVPNAREAGANHEVRRYDSVEASVRSYIVNLNTNPAYREFRQLRFNQRRNGKNPAGYSLVPGLPSYSERRGEYLVEILAMIKANRKYMKQL